MKKRLTTTALTILLTACGGESDIPAETPAVSAPAPAAIVETIPAEPLAVGGSLTISQQAGAKFASPLDSAWSGFAASSVDLTLAPPVHQSVNLRHDPGAATRPVKVQAASDGERLYLRLRWQDDSRDASTSRTEFADGVAVQFALDGGAATSFMMGAANAPVNIWYWKAGANQAENLAAGGFGSTTKLDLAGLEVSAKYLDAGEWAVVLSRPLQVETQYQVDLVDFTGHISLAVWEGDERQRDGLKHVTMGWLALGGES